MRIPIDYVTDYFAKRTNAGSSTIAQLKHLETCFIRNILAVDMLPLDRIDTPVDRWGLFVRLSTPNSNMMILYTRFFEEIQPYDDVCIFYSDDSLLIKQLLQYLPCGFFLDDYF